MHILPRISCLVLLYSVAAACLPAQAPRGARTASALLAEGQKAMQHGDFPGAEILFQRAVVAAPQFAPASLALGLVQLREGAVDGAVRSLGNAAALNPRLQGAHLFLGIAQYQVGQNDAALASLQAELKLNPDDLEALTWVGITALGSNRPELAIASLDHAVEINPKDAQILYYCARAHELVAEATLTKLAKLDPDSELVHRARAEDFGRSGLHEKATAEYLLALEKQPNDADVLEELGQEQEDLGRLEASQRTFQQVLTINSHSALAMYNLGKMEVETGNPQHGVVLLRQAQAAHASVAPVDFYLGLGLSRLGQNEDAAHWMELSLASEPSTSIRESALYQIARVYAKLNRKEDAARALDNLKALKAASVQGAREPVLPAPSGSAAEDVSLPAVPQP